MNPVQETQQQKIYFALIHFDRPVHAPAKGLTMFQTVYAYGTHVTDARERIHKHFREKYNLGIIREMIFLALRQDESEYFIQNHIIK